MKKVVFALEVFSIMALLLSYVILEISHEASRLPSAVSYPVIAVEKSTIAKPVAAKFKEQRTIPFPLQFIAVFIKNPS